MKHTRPNLMVGKNSTQWTTLWFYITIVYSSTWTPTILGPTMIWTSSNILVSRNIIVIFCTIWWLLWIFLKKSKVHVKENVHYVKARSKPGFNIWFQSCYRVKTCNKMHINYIMQVEWKISGIKRKWRCFIINSIPPIQNMHIVPNWI